MVKDRRTETNQQKMDLTLPAVTEILELMLHEAFQGEMKFTLFLTDGNICGMSGTNSTEHTFKHIKAVIEQYDKGHVDFVDLNKRKEEAH